MIGIIASHEVELQDSMNKSFRSKFFVLGLVFVLYRASVGCSALRSRRSAPGPVDLHGVGGGASRNLFRWKSP